MKIKVAQYDNPFVVFYVIDGEHRPRRSECHVSIDQAEVFVDPAPGDGYIESMRRLVSTWYERTPCPIKWKPT